MFIIALLLAVFIGFSAALLLMGFWVSKSNDRGNSKGSFFHFSEGHSVWLIDSRDKIKY